MPGLKDRLTDAGYGLGWSVVCRLPESGAQSAFRFVADLAWRRQGPGEPKRAARGGPPVFRVYHKLLDRLSARGFPRGPAETPDEFATRLVAAQVLGAEAFQKLTDHYTAARYGDREVPDGALAALAGELEAVGRRRSESRPAA